MSIPTASSADRTPRVGGDALGGVEGDPDPQPNVVYVSASLLPVDETTAGLDAAPAAPAPADPGPSWTDLVDAHRADFELGPRAGTP